MMDLKDGMCAKCGLHPSDCECERDATPPLFELEAITHGLWLAGMTAQQRQAYEFIQELQDVIKKLAEWHTSQFEREAAGYRRQIVRLLSLLPPKPVFIPDPRQSPR